MKNKTLVLDINELYEVIPEAKVLEGKNFKDIRELLKQLITAIEESGQWEFIQHIQNKPSLFVIREVQLIDIPKVVQEVTKLDVQKLEEKFNKLSEAVQQISVSGESHPEVIERVIKIQEEIKTSVYDNDFYKSTETSSGESKPTLPWEK